MKVVRKLGFIEDLGSIETKDGKKIRKGKLYRTSTLGKIKEKSGIKLKERLNLARIIDLRSESELNKHPDVVIDGVSYHHLPPLSDQDNPAITRKNAIEVLKNISKEKGGAEGHLQAIYRKLISSEQAIESYRLMLRDIIDHPDDTTIWHCTQGKDRTGIGSAIILLTLGVEKEDVINDYLKYNKHHRFKNKLIFIGVTLVMMSVKMAKNLNCLLTAHKSYMEAAFDEMEKLFGSVDNYIHEALELSDEDIEILKNNYLIEEKVNG